MYCANCGVKLADSETRCPLCGTKAYHPDLPRTPGEPGYPQNKYPNPESNRLGFPIFATGAFLVPILTVLACDLRFTGGVSWSGFVLGALLLLYITCILPLWFKSPNPVIFVPCGFAAAGLYLLYINWAVGGNWFLSFAFPLTGCFGGIVTAVVALLRYVRRGKLYIYGGAFMAFGCSMLLMEFLLGITFPALQFMGWSIYPMATFVLLGGFLIFLAICRPAREVMERKFFI